MSNLILSHEAISNVQAQFPDHVSVIGEGAQQALLIEPEYLLAIMGVLKNDSAYQFNMLSSLTAVDYVDYFELVYHLYSLPLGNKVTIKTRCRADKPTVPTVMTIWPSADFQEREVYDLLGISFLGHKDLRRIFLPDDFVEHPLRKGYKLTTSGEGRL